MKPATRLLFLTLAAGAVIIASGLRTEDAQAATAVDYSCDFDLTLPSSTDISFPLGAGSQRGGSVTGSGTATCLEPVHLRGMPVPLSFSGSWTTSQCGPGAFRLSGTLTFAPPDGGEHDTATMTATADVQTSTDPMPAQVSLDSGQSGRGTINLNGGNDTLRCASYAPAFEIQISGSFASSYALNDARDPFSAPPTSVDSGPAPDCSPGNAASGNLILGSNGVGTSDPEGGFALLTKGTPLILVPVSTAAHGPSQPTATGVSQTTFGTDGVARWQAQLGHLQTLKQEEDGSALVLEGDEVTARLAATGAGNDDTPVAVSVDDQQPGIEVHNDGPEELTGDALGATPADGLCVAPARAAADLAATEPSDQAMGPTFRCSHDIFLPFLAGGYANGRATLGCQKASGVFLKSVNARLFVRRGGGQIQRSRLARNTTAGTKGSVVIARKRCIGPERRTWVVVSNVTTFATVKPYFVQSGGFNQYDILCQ